jgi:hypothetical protein
LGHSAITYKLSVTAKGQPNKPLLLGNFDGAGTGLASEIKRVLPLVASAANSSRKHTSRYEGDLTLASTPADLYVGSSLLGMRTGEHSVENIANVGRAVAKLESDTSEYRLAVVCWTPVAGKSGLLSITSVNTHSPLTEVREAFKKITSGFTIQLTPLIDREAFKTAVQNEWVTTVSLKARRSASGSFATRSDGTSNMIDVRTTVKPVGRKTRLVWSDLSGYFGLNPQKPAFEYAGVTYDEASVTIEKPNGQQRTYVLADTDRGRTLAEPMNEFDDTNRDDYGYTAEEFAAGLVSAIDRNKQS